MKKTIITISVLLMILPAVVDASFIASSPYQVISNTNSIVINGNRSDVYVANGTSAFPYKTYDAAFAALIASGASSAEIHVIPGTAYIEVADLVLPNIPITIYGNNSTLLMCPGSGVYTCTVQIPNNFSWYDATILGNVNEYDASITDAHSFQNSQILGSVTMTGNATINNSVILDQPAASSTLTVRPGSLVNITGSNVSTVMNVQGTIAMPGILNLNNINQSTATSTRPNIIATSTGSIIHINGMSMSNANSGGGIYAPNNASLLNPNQITGIGIMLGTSSPYSIYLGTSTGFGQYQSYTMDGNQLVSTSTNFFGPWLPTMNTMGSSTIGTTTQANTAASKLFVVNEPVGNGTVATTTTNWADYATSTSRSCYNVNNAAGVAVSWYINAANSITVENNKCR